MKKSIKGLFVHFFICFSILMHTVVVSAAAYEFRTGEDGKLYWYEDGIRQGTYDDPKGVLGDGTVRGREIYDPATNGWYWLDSVYNGAKACGKEVWIPYIYQDEDTYSESQIVANANASDDGLQNFVANSIRSKTGKWVRYDENGKMLKGWVTIEGILANYYPNQIGNTYYYDYKTGLMAKGKVTLGGKNYYFNEITGVLENNQEEIDNKTTNDESLNLECNGYIYTTTSYSMYYYVVKNIGSNTVGIDGNAVAYDKNGNQVGADTSDLAVLAPGETSIMSFFFNDATSVNRVECSLSPKSKTYYRPVLSNLSVTPSRNNNSLVLSITNTGNINADYVEAHALFFDASGKVIYHEENYFTDIDYEIKPSETITGQLTSPYDFSRVEYYLTGRSDGKSSPINPNVDERSFSVSEYGYEYGNSTYYYLIIKNNSDKAVKIGSNLTAYNSNGTAIGADYESVTVLGSDEETIIEFFMNQVTGVDHIGYSMLFDTNPSYEPVLKYLSSTANSSGKNVIISVSNHGSDAAKFIKGTVLFFDSNGRIVGSSSDYFTDSDYEIKPGATITKQISSYKNFASYKYYFDGRK